MAGDSFSHRTVTFDVFSALIGSRTGGATFFDFLAHSRGLVSLGQSLFDRWDATNKHLHSAQRSWIPFREISEETLSVTLDGFNLSLSSVRNESDALLDSMAEWPLWPDVSPEVLLGLGAGSLGLLCNIDDDLPDTTVVARMGIFDPRFIVSSERARAYKPSAVIYTRATELLGSFTHIASSARDVRGALRAGVACIRLVRPGHGLDPGGPVPTLVAESVPDLWSYLSVGDRESDLI